MKADTSLRSIKEEDDEDDEDGDDVDAEDVKEEEEEKEEVSTPMGSFTSTMTPLRGEAFRLLTWYRAKMLTGIVFEVLFFWNDQNNNYNCYKYTFQLHFHKTPNVTKVPIPSG